MFDKDEPVGQMAKQMGKLFAIMADEVIKEMGEEEGSRVIKKAVHRYGAMRGLNIRNKVLAANEELTFENMEKYYDLPPNNSWDATTEIEGDVLIETTRYCPFADAWRELGLEKVGQLYCGIDFAMNEAYMGKIEFERPYIFSDGEDAPCKMIVKKVKN